MLKFDPHLETIRQTFVSHMSGDEQIEPMGKGNGRFAYSIGMLNIGDMRFVSLLLKLYKADRKYKSLWEQATDPDSDFGEFCEYGAFETYFQFTNGEITQVEYVDGSQEPFPLTHGWGGAYVEPGDLGALPYFQMAVKYGDLYGQLTEGLPPLIWPKGTAGDSGTGDDYVVERDRIIDLGRTQSQLMLRDRGGNFSLNDEPPNLLGLNTKGKKYFEPEYRLDLA